MFDLKAYMTAQRDVINAHLERYLDRLVPSATLSDSIRYALMGNGKRLRPVLCISANAALGGDDPTILPTACALEMIHTYSLIHDDLPALDNDELRRGRPTCHVQFDEATAILTGDALLTMAFETISEQACNAPATSYLIYLKVLHRIAAAAGCRGMIEGQARDLAFEGVKLTQNALEHMHALKTGALISAAVECGGLLGNGSEKEIMQLRAYAQKIGLAFQVVDDILNVTGDSKLMGKAVGTDQIRKKNTYPALLGLARAGRYAQSLIDDALNAISCFDKKADPLRAIAHYITARKR